MSLSYTGQVHQGLSFKSFMAKNSDDETVVVQITTEVEQDYGIGAAQSVADKLYAADPKSPVFVGVAAMEAAGF